MFLAVPTVAFVLLHTSSVESKKKELARRRQVELSKDYMAKVAMYRRLNNKERQNKFQVEVDKLLNEIY